MPNKLRCFAIAVLACVTTGCLDGSGCGNTEESRTRSPNGVFDAVVFVRDCGATTAYSAQVALVRAETRVADAPANVFIDAHKVSIEVRWRGNDTLEVRHPHAAPLLAATQVSGVAITYGEAR